MGREPLGEEVAEDNENARDGEGDERERDEQESTKAALEEGPTVDGKVVGAADTLHESGDDAGRTDDSEDEGDDKSMGRARAVGLVDEITLKERTDVRRKDTIEQDGELGADGGVVWKETDDRGGDDERGKERHHGGIGGGLGKIEPVVARCAKEGKVKDSKMAQESSHGICPRMKRATKLSTC